MRKIELKEIMDKFGIVKTELSTMLFPGNKYPEKALERVIKGESTLDADQVFALAQYIGVPMERLYMKEGWDARFAVKAGAHIFSKGDFQANLEYSKGHLSIFKKETLVHEEYLIQKGITLSEFLQFLDDTIVKLNNKENESKN